MRPLSTINFIKNNKRHTVSSGIAIVIAIIFLFIFECFIESITQSARYVNGSVLQKQIEFSRRSDKVIPRNIVDEVKGSADIGKIIPAIFQYTSYNIFGGGGGTYVYGLHSKDVPYFLKRHIASLESGRLPKKENEIALNVLVAKNRGLKIGDKMGSNVDKTDCLSGKYTIVGLLCGTDCVSLSGDPYTKVEGKVSEERLLQNSFLAFPKAGRVDEAGKSLMKYSNGNIVVYTLSLYNEDFAESDDYMKMMDVVALISVIVIAVCLVCSKYAQFYNRKTEFGVLYAMGFSRQTIMWRALREVTAANIGSFIVGFALGLLSSVVVVGGMFGNNGGTPVFICEKAVVLSVIAPLFTTLFTLIPVFRMLSSVDPVSVIEAN